jgi:hypothetical protein
MRTAFCLTILLLLGACATGSRDSGPGDVRAGGGGTDATPRLAHTSEEAELFIRRFEAFRVGLVNYYDVTGVDYVSRSFSADTVLFRLDNTGDSGPFHEAATDLAAELAVTHGWEDAGAPDELVRPGRLATVRLESIGIPAGARAGDTIPVRVTMIGNGTDIHGGYAYEMPMVNSLGRTVAVLKQGYLPFDLRAMDPEDITDELREDAKNLERRDTLVGSSFILRNAVRLATDMATDDLTSDQIILPLRRRVDGDTTVATLDDARMRRDVKVEIERLMAEAGVPVQVDESPGRLTVKPIGIREQSLRQVHDILQSLQIEVRPHDRVVITFDDDRGRVAIYGEPRHRMLIGDVNLTTDPFTRGQRTPYQLPFRVSCRVVQRAEPGTSGKFGIPDADDLREGVTPDGHMGRVRLAWSRWDRRGRMTQEGTEEIDTTDISLILRHLYTRGMDPRGVLAFVVEAESSMALSADLGFNYRTIDLEAMAREAE